MEEFVQTNQTILVNLIGVVFGKIVSCSIWNQIEWARQVDAVDGIDEMIEASVSAGKKDVVVAF